MSLFCVLQALRPRLKKSSAHEQKNVKGSWMMQFPAQSLARPSLHASRMLEQPRTKQETTSSNTLSAGGAQKPRGQLMQDRAFQIRSTLPPQLLGLCSVQRSTTSRVPPLKWLQPLAALFLIEPLWTVKCQRHDPRILRKPRTCFLSTAHRARKTSMLARLSSPRSKTHFLEPFGARFFLICSMISRNSLLRWTWAMITTTT